MFLITDYKPVRPEIALSRLAGLADHAYQSGYELETLVHDTCGEDQLVLSIGERVPDMVGGEQPQPEVVLILNYHEPVPEGEGSSRRAVDVPSVVCFERIR